MAWCSDHGNQQKTKMAVTLLLPTYFSTLMKIVIFGHFSQSRMIKQTTLLLFNVLIVLMMIPSVNEITNLKVFFKIFT